MTAAKKPPVAEPAVVRDITGELEERAARAEVRVDELESEVEGLRQNLGDVADNNLLLRDRLASAKSTLLRLQLTADLGFALDMSIDAEVRGIDSVLRGS